MLTQFPNTYKQELTGSWQTSCKGQKKYTFSDLQATDLCHSYSTLPL